MGASSRAIRNARRCSSEVLTLIVSPCSPLCGAPCLPTSVLRPSPVGAESSRRRIALPRGQRCPSRRSAADPAATGPCRPRAWPPRRRPRPSSGRQRSRRRARPRRLDRYRRSPTWPQPLARDACSMRRPQAHRARLGRAQRRRAPHRRDGAFTFETPPPGAPLLVKAPGFEKRILSPTPGPIEVVLKPHVVKAAYLTYYGVGDRTIRAASSTWWPAPS